MRPAASGESNAPSRHRRSFRTVSVLLALVICPVLVESLLRWHARRVEAAEVLEGGLVDYDPDLGWKLVPYANGAHRCSDYSVHYSINGLGFRADTRFPDPTDKRDLVVFIGDSFTFGFGVNDTETFPHLLAQSGPTGTVFANCSVPGYSTDQELLLLEKKVLGLHPHEVLLVVYLGNDLFDNQLDVALQVRAPKPYFDLGPPGLVLQNTPVPLEHPARTKPLATLASAVWGPDPAKWGLRARLEVRFALFRLFSETCLPNRDYREQFAARFAPAVRLFDAILDRIADDCSRNRVKLRLVLLAGKSFVEKPTSPSAQYQDFFRTQVIAACAKKGLGVVDVARQMQDRYRREAIAWFFPHDGHLTPGGHRVVAELLAPQFTARRALAARRRRNTRPEIVALPDKPRNNSFVSE